MREECMNSICDPSAPAVSNAHAEIQELFERIWRELRGREKAAPGSDLARSKIWLECSGELVDAESAVAIGIREPVPGVELLRILCPRCGGQHESLRFG